MEVLEKPISFSSIFKVDQYKEIAAGKSAIVFYGKIPDTYVGFIEKVGTSDWYENTYMLWLLDHVRVEKVERVIGFINSPTTYNPPILVKDEIKWIGYNNDTEAHIFEVLCDGIAYSRSYRFKR